MEGTNIQPARRDLKYELADYKWEMAMRKKLDPVVDKLIIKKGRGSLWEVVDEILKFLWKEKRAKMTQLLKEIAYERERHRGNQFAAGKTGVRLLGSMPDELELILNRVYLDELDARAKKFRYEFFTRYPAFRIADRI